jgi:Gp49-like protein DUF891
MDARFIVVFDPDAVRDLDSLKGKQERNAVYTVIDKVRMPGPDLKPPHVKTPKGEAGLLELRPRQGTQDRRGVRDPGFFREAGQRRFRGRGGSEAFTALSALTS